MMPTPEQIARQQASVARLTALDEWTEEPFRTDQSNVEKADLDRAVKEAPQSVSEPQLVPAPIPVPENAVAAPEIAPAPASAAPVAAQQPEKPKMPWEIPNAAAAHPYNILFTEELFQKLTYVCTRTGHRSVREYVLRTLDRAARESLKQLGHEE